MAQDAWPTLTCPLIYPSPSTYPTQNRKSLVCERDVFEKCAVIAHLMETTAATGNPTEEPWVPSDPTGKTPWLFNLRDHFLGHWAQHLSRPGLQVSPFPTSDHAKLLQLTQISCRFPFLADFPWVQYVQFLEFRGPLAQCSPFQTVRRLQRLFQLIFLPRHRAATRRCFRKPRSGRVSYSIMPHWWTFSACLTLQHHNTVRYCISLLVHHQVKVV